MSLFLTKYIFLLVYNFNLLSAVDVKMLWEVGSQVAVHKNYNNSIFLQNKAINKGRIILE